MRHKRATAHGPPHNSCGSSLFKNIAECIKNSRPFPAHNTYASENKSTPTLSDMLAWCDRIITVVNTSHRHALTTLSPRSHVGQGPAMFLGKFFAKFHLFTWKTYRNSCFLAILHMFINSKKIGELVPDCFGCIRLAVHGEIQMN